LLEHQVFSVSSAETEARILRLLESDAQASVAELAEQAGVSKPTVRKYIDKLESEGVIVGYSADIDPKKLSSQSIALVGMDVASDQYVEATRALKAVDEVESLYTSSGDHMLMAEVRAPDGDALGEVISDELLAIEGVTAAHPAILQERLK
jgi:Lrp/AsnC family transcriptional regulator for asnA, asnC and gidA